MTTFHFQVVAVDNDIVDPNSFLNKNYTSYNTHLEL